MLVVRLFCAWLVADFITGVAHWFEDRYLVNGQIARENELHHTKPTAMLCVSEWENVRQTVTISTTVAVVLCFVGAPMVVWLGAWLAGWGNLVHRWAHSPLRSRPWLIRQLQRVGFFISTAEHDAHHKAMGELIPKSDAKWKFCAMTNYLNPVLDAVRFWSAAEWLLARVGLQVITNEPPCPQQVRQCG